MDSGLPKEYGYHINDWVEACFDASSRSGWWDEVSVIESCLKDHHSPRIQNFFDKTVVASKLDLIHSELSEALEGYRKDLYDTHLPNRLMIEVELADACIRIFDLAGYLNLDLEGAIIEKFEYNKNRPDHKKENRMKEGGKKI